MKITINFDYFTTNVIPPRCRNPRTVWDKATLVVDVPEVTAAEAPVAFRVPQSEGTACDYRWWGQRLWTAQQGRHDDEPARAGDGRFPAEVDMNSAGGDGLDEVTARLRALYADFLIIDGIVWEACQGEPLYVVWTFGFGGNHGSTALLIDTQVRGSLSTHFRADQYETAVARALEVARARRDDESVFGITNAPRIEVLIPEAIRADPQRDAAIAYATEDVPVTLPRRTWAEVGARLARAASGELPTARAAILQAAGRTTADD